MIIRTSAAAPTPRLETSAVARAFAWHRPLMALAALMLVSAVLSLVGMIVDPRMIVGAPAWAKPLKFSLSIFFYAVTWAWLIAHLPRWRRAAHALGTVVAAALVVEQLAIVWAAASGTTSHFNVSDGVHAAVWAAMAVAIAVVYLCALVTSIAVFFLRLPTPSLTFAVRAGAVIGLAGLGVAFFMTSPTSAQLSSFQGIAGAHAVGVVDGGPGLPLLGWSTVGGDYRAPHFIGMHALQLLPLLALAIRAVGVRWQPLRSSAVQLRLAVIAAAVYAATFVLITAQAMAGQSVVHPDGIFLVGAVAIAVSGLSAAAIVIAGGGVKPPALSEARIRLVHMSTPENSGETLGAKPDAAPNIAPDATGETLGAEDSDNPAVKDPADWVTGDEPMTAPQRSYLDTLAREAGEEISADLTKAEASENIDRLQDKTGRSSN